MYTGRLTTIWPIKFFQGSEKSTRIFKIAYWEAILENTDMDFKVDFSH